MYFSLERRHYVTFHPFGILGHYLLMFTQTKRGICVGYFFKFCDTQDILTLLKWTIALCRFPFFRVKMIFRALDQTPLICQIQPQCLLDQTLRIETRMALRSMLQANNHLKKELQLYKICIKRDKLSTPRAYGEEKEIIKTVLLTTQ